jgi:hypothetical protein
MAMKEDLLSCLEEALQAHGGREGLIQVCRYIWDHHESELKDSGNLFYTWQFDVPWVATLLRHAEFVKPANSSPPGIWELA